MFKADNVLSSFTGHFLIQGLPTFDTEYKTLILM